MPIDWNAVFTTCSREPPATREDLRQLAVDLSRPLAPYEVEKILAGLGNPFSVADPLAPSWRPFSPASWRMPSGELPASYESFLLSSNGGPVRTSEMEFCFFGTRELRDFMLRYHVPEYMPLAIPFGLDGAGNFALFDARAPLDAGEYPVLLAATGNLCFDDARLLARTFEGFCRRTKRIEAAFDLSPLRPPSQRAVAEREARFAAQSAQAHRITALALAETAFSAGDFTRVVEVLGPYRASLAGSVELKLSIAEKRRAGK